MDLPDSDRGDFSCWRAVDSSSSVMMMGLLGVISNLISIV